MKVILKGGSLEKNKEMRKFFMESIFPILDFGIALEPSNSVITVFEKRKDGSTREYIDPTAEVIVELTEEARNMATDPETDANELKKYTGEFHDEALAIKLLQSVSLSFSIEYYSCRYKPPGQQKPAEENDCQVCGSIEHMQSSTGKCPGCGKP